MNSHFSILKYITAVILFLLFHADKFSVSPLLIKTPNGLSENFYRQPPPGPNQKLYCGFAHTLAIKPDSTIWAWGNNSQGQLGNGNLSNASSPLKLNGITGVTDAAGGYEHSLALKADGTVWSWGRNFEGELGDGTLTQRTTPVKVGGGLTNVVNVASGYYHSFAIKSDGTLWSWGQNTYGQLGNGNKFNSVAANKISALTGVTDAGGGEGYSVALKSNGSVWTWGTNNEGELGDGTLNQRNTPAQVNGIIATAISAGKYHILVLKANGTVWAWGYNGYGQLGDGTTGTQNIPVQVSGLSNVVAIAAGENHSLAVKNDGTVWVWGYNGEGQLGNGTTDGNAHNLPVQIGNFTSSNLVCAGTHSMAVKNDGSVWAWGNNGKGQLGDGTKTAASIPQLSLFTFTTVARVALPVFSPDGGSYIASQNVTITCSTSGATIRYTTNGTDPTASDPVIASGSAVNITGPTKILKAKAFKTGLSHCLYILSYLKNRMLSGNGHYKAAC